MSIPLTLAYEATEPWVNHAQASDYVLSLCCTKNSDPTVWERNIERVLSDQHIFNHTERDGAILYQQRPDALDHIWQHIQQPSGSWTALAWARRYCEEEHPADR